MVYCVGKLIENLNDSVLLKLFYESNRPQFLWVYGVITHLGCWENTREVVYHSLRLCDSQAFLEFSQHPAWAITTLIP